MKFLRLTIYLLFGAIVSSAQITSTRSSNDKTSASEVVRAQDAVNKVLADSGILFKEGLIQYEDKKLADAGEKFNKAVEVFLYSSLNLQRDAKLQGCYNQLIETIYRIEFPTESQLPQIRSLAQTCGWTNIDAVQADKITTLARNSIVKTGGMVAAKPNVSSFNTQAFEPSPLDELSKLELTPEERDVSSKEVYKRATAPCTSSKAPSLRGLRFGLTPSQVSKIIGLPVNSRKMKKTIIVYGSVVYQVNVGESSLFYFSATDPKRPQLDGIQSILLGFLDNSLYEIYVSYEKQVFKWKDGEEFSLIVSEKLGLPTNAWSIYGSNATIRCKGFWVSAYVLNDGSSELFLESVVIDKAVKARAKQAVLKEQQRKRDAELDKKRVFKP